MRKTIDVFDITAPDDSFSFYKDTNTKKIPREYELLEMVLAAS